MHKSLCILPFPSMVTVCVEQWNRVDSCAHPALLCCSLGCATICVLDECWCTDTETTSMRDKEAYLCYSSVNSLIYFICLFIICLCVRVCSCVEYVYKWDYLCVRGSVRVCPSFGSLSYSLWDFIAELCHPTFYFNSCENILLLQC